MRTWKQEALGAACGSVVFGSAADWRCRRDVPCCEESLIRPWVSLWHWNTGSLSLCFSKIMKLSEARDGMCVRIITCF